ncbi:hypothetical protein Trydic_g6414 [Trypoxylus dichotomus]
MYDKTVKFAPRRRLKQTYGSYNINIFRCRYGKFTIYQRYVQVFMICTGLILLSGCRYAFFFYCYMGGIETNDTSIYPPMINYTGLTLEGKQPTKEQWTDEKVFQVTYAFQVGYTLCHIPAGILADFHGGKHYFALSTLSCGIFTMILPFILKVSGFKQHLMLQFLHGVLQGAAMPAAWSILARWVPKSQITVLTSLPYSCLHLGHLLSITAASYFIMYKKFWEGTFLIWGITIIIWYIIAIITIFSQPQAHPWVSARELQIIEADIGNKAVSSVPWREILEDPSIWAIITASSGDILLETVVALTIPDYVESEEGYYFRRKPMLFLLPYILQLVLLIIISCIADRLIAKKSIETVYIRSIYTFIGTVFPSLFLLLGAYLRRYFGLAMTCFVFVTIISSFTMAGALVNVLDRTRYYAGFVKGLDNGIPTFLAYSCRLFIMGIETNPKDPKWTNIFWFNLAMGLFTTMVYLKWCKGSSANWDMVLTQLDRRLSVISQRSQLFHENEETWF